jgi:hypothetical protein
MSGFEPFDHDFPDRESPSASPPGARTPEPDTLTVPVPARFQSDWCAPDLPPVRVAEVLARENRDRVMWYEIAALCEALLGRSPVAGAAGGPTVEQIENAIRYYLDASGVGEDVSARALAERIAALRPPPSQETPQ